MEEVGKVEVTGGWTPTGLLAGAVAMAGGLSTFCERTKHKQMVATVAARTRTTSRKVKRRVYEEAKAYAEHRRSGAVSPVPVAKTPEILDDKSLAKISKLLLARYVATSFAGPIQSCSRHCQIHNTILSSQGADTWATVRGDETHQSV